MAHDLEETLSRELQAVADGLHIPAMPALPDASPRERRWVPMLAAAVVVLFVAGGIAVGALGRGDNPPDPAPPSPSPSPSATDLPSPTGAGVQIPTAAPTMPYVLDQALYVDGAQVPGDWWSVESGANGWLAWRPDLSWWWGSGPDANRIEGLADVPPVISPNGRYVGVLTLDGNLSGFDTDPSGEDFGDLPIDVGDRELGTQVTVRAVTDDGLVIAQGTETAVMWRPLVDGRLFDLTETEPGQVVVGNTPLGLVVTDGEDGEAYLAHMTATGALRHLGALPEHDQLHIDPTGTWLAYTPLGTEGGEVDRVTSLQVASVAGAGGFSLPAPDGKAFRIAAWTWEDDAHLLATVIDLDVPFDVVPKGERLARCSVEARRCVLVEAP